MGHTKPASQMTATEHTARYLTRHFQVANLKPVALEEEKPVELAPMTTGRYLAYDFEAPSHREITFRVLARGELKITVNGEAALDVRQPHFPGKEPPGGWHHGWHEVVVWPDRLIDGWVRIGVENPAVESTGLVVDGMWVCSGAPMVWRPRSTPLATAHRVDASFAPDARLSDPAWHDVPALELLKASLGEFSARSEVRFLYDDKGLYLGFSGDGRPVASHGSGQGIDEAASESSPDIPGARDGYQPSAMAEEFLSLVLDPAADGHELVELLVNASDEKEASRSRRTGVERLWGDEIKETAAGTETERPSYQGAGYWYFDDLDEASWGCWTDIHEEGWSVCMAVPFSLLGQRPSQGDVWHFNACRRTYGEHRLEYFASPHAYQYHAADRFAQLLFGGPAVLPVSANLGSRVSGERVATLDVRLAGDEPKTVSGVLNMDGRDESVMSRETLRLVPGEEDTLTFDLDLPDEPASTLRLALLDGEGTALYRSEPIEIALAHAHAQPAPLGEGQKSLFVGGPERPIDWRGAVPEAPKVSLASRRREHAAFQIGLAPTGADLNGVRVETSGLSGPHGAVLPTDAVEWFVEGEMHRKLSPAYLLRREIPNHRVRWAPDVLVPVESFAVGAGERQSIWVHVDVPAEADLGRYAGYVTVLADGHPPRRIEVELEVEGFAEGKAAGDALDIGSTKQLLVDDYIVGEIEGARVRYHAFEKSPRNPLIVPDGPADLNLMGIYGTVIRDTSGRFQMWHLSHSSGGANGVVEHLCYVESDDGLEWRKPDLGVLEFNGSTKNNLVDRSKEGHAIGPHVIYRPDEPDPDRRYMRYFQAYPVRGTCATYSPDGVHWRPDPTPLFFGSDAATPTRDPRTGRYYVFTIEDRAIGAYVRRSPGVSTSEDGVHWSEFRPVFWADALDDRRAFNHLSRVRRSLCYDYPDHFHCEFNDMRPYPYAGLYLASLTVFETCSVDLYKGTPGGRGSGKDDCSTHLQLMSSRSSDLTEWQRAGDRQPIIDRGAPGEWDAGFMSASDFPVAVGDELWLYYGGFAFTQQHQSCQVAVGGVLKPGDVPTGIGLATMRLDGFASLDAGREPGRLVTKKLRFTGRRLELNAIVRGSLRVAVLDAEGHPIEGLGEAECEPLRGDSVRHKVRWSAQPDLRHLNGKPVRLAFHLQDAELYAFQFIS